MEYLYLWAVILLIVGLILLFWGLVWLFTQTNKVNPSKVPGLLIAVGGAFIIVALILAGLGYRGRKFDEQVAFTQENFD